jgi:undecaprenyl pyrophosphate phosphatase UppP
LDREARAAQFFNAIRPSRSDSAAIYTKSIPPEGFILARSGFATAAISGYFALTLLLRFVRQGRLHWFGIYCILAAIWAFTL